MSTNHRSVTRFGLLVAAALVALAAVGCPTDDPDPPPLDPGKQWECIIPEGKYTAYREQIGCREDFYVLASQPLDSSIPGARSAKTVIDQADGNRLYFQNSNTFQIHYEFASEYLSGDGLPPVGDIGLFNQTEYYSPSRRFLLGALTIYEEPDIFVYEIAPYDAASPEMVVTAFELIRENTYIGKELLFHPTSMNIEMMAEDLPPSVPVITTEELFEGIDYQPLNLGESYGQLRFFTAEELLTEYVSPRDVVVLDQVPNDISVVAGLITSEMQTPLSHVNVLSQNRGTPNMALKGAFDNEDLRALDMEWVYFEVDAFDWEVTLSTKELADEWWEDHKPPPVTVPDLDLSVREFVDIELLTWEDVPAFGGKAANYGEMATIEDMPSPKAFGIPVYFYKQFEEQNGFDVQIAEMLEDEEFLSNPAVRDQALEDLREAMKAAPVDPIFEMALMLKLEYDYPGERMRFRSSTNAEDLAGFSGAGLYTSWTGDPNDPTRPVLDAVRTVWAALWNFRAFEERTYNGIDHQGVAMALLVHHSFPDEEANGVALTNNMFDETQPGFYINVQYGEASVVLPDPGITVDSFLYYYYYPGQPMTYFQYSNLTPPGETVLTAAQAYELGKALDAIQKHFIPIYGTTPGQFFAMDVEFKFDDDCFPQHPEYPDCPPDGEPLLWVKQARPHPGWAGE